MSTCVLFSTQSFCGIIFTVGIALQPFTYSPVYFCRVLSFFLASCSLNSVAAILFNMLLMHCATRHIVVWQLLPHLRNTCCTLGHFLGIDSAGSQVTTGNLASNANMRPFLHRPSATGSLQPPLFENVSPTNGPPLIILSLAILELWLAQGFRLVRLFFHLFALFPVPFGVAGFAFLWRDRRRSGRGSSGIMIRE